MRCTGRTNRENLKSSYHFKDIGDRIILKWILKVLDQRDGLDSSGSGLGLMAGCCEKSNELSCFITRGKFLNQLTVHLFLKKDFVSWK